MRNELSQVLERLGQASAALDRIVGAAGEKLGAIQGDLGEKIDEMQQRPRRDGRAGHRARPPVDRDAAANPA